MNSYGKDLDKENQGKKKKKKPFESKTQRMHKQVIPDSLAALVSSGD